MKTTPEQRARLRELESKATPGPWNTDHDGTFVAGPYVNGDWDWIVIKSDNYDGYPLCLEENNALIAESRNALPGLLDDIDTLEAENLSLKIGRDALSKLVDDLQAI